VALADWRCDSTIAAQLDSEISSQSQVGANESLAPYGKYPPFQVARSTALVSKLENADG
jgi:hypothetical protein